ncbi:MAG: hypothetical protein QE284_15280 [Rhizobium sp.]|nr:hypothetical protein [Rhizobium sp.]
MALRSLNTSTVLGALVCLVLAPPASAQEKLEWLGWSGEGAASLVYGVAESDHVLLSLSCDQGSPIRLVYPYEPKHVRDDGAYDLTLQVGKQTLSMKTTGTRLEMDDLFILEGDLPKGTNLVSLLTGGKILTVGVDKDLSELPLEGAAQAASALLEICGR